MPNPRMSTKRSKDTTNSAKRRAPVPERARQGGSKRCHQWPETNSTTPSWPASRRRRTPGGTQTGWALPEGMEGNGPS
eukprot:2828590-Pyramimonas_sp.AAC.1